MTALVVFDVEAVPDLEMARRLLEQPDDTPDADSKYPPAKPHRR